MAQRAGYLPRRPGGVQFRSQELIFQCSGDHPQVTNSSRAKFAKSKRFDQLAEGIGKEVIRCQTRGTHDPALHHRRFAPPGAAGRGLGPAVLP
jgi:hypothetical protein